MKHYDVIIIGGGPSGIIAGVTGKKQNSDKSFLMIKEEAKGLVPCGIPYVFHDLDDVSKNAMGPQPFVDAGGEVLVDTVGTVDLKAKTVTTITGNEFSYTKLIFATGSIPTIPTFIKGYDLKGVEYVKKSYNYIEQLKTRTDAAKNIIVIGAGFIGVEIAEQLAKYKEKCVSLVEMEKHCLYRAFSQDFAAKADTEVKAAGVHLYTETKVEEIVGKDGKVAGVRLSNGKTLDADIVISSVGYKPNTELAKKSGLELNSHGAIRVDNYQRTDTKDVYAVGDCSATRGFITGRADNIMLASTATAEARVLGYNLFCIKVLRNFTGTLSVFSTEINHKAFASAGAIEQAAEEADIKYVVGKFADVDRHPATIADTYPLEVKLIANPENGEIIGGELYGGKGVGEMINIIALAIQKAITVYEFVSFQFGTHPLLTTAPTKYVLVKAAEMAIAQINNCKKQSK
ncbi:MAG: FAD-dependent oxidoreductase [Candidatus Marinimicrobia bacterium]|nr:FAD-dependent oxidoreductase [Candidatus Neomarinimicrobiota bacterium]